MISLMRLELFKATVYTGIKERVRYSLICMISLRSFTIQELEKLSWHWTLSQAKKKRIMHVF